MAQSLMLQHTSIAVEGRIKVLINNDLKAICRAYDQPVSGNKLQLQQRCISVLADIVQRGDVTAYNTFSARVANHGMLPTSITRVADLGATSVVTPMGRPIGVSSPHAHLEWRNSPFYERIEQIVRPSDMPEMPQNRHVVKTNLILSDQQAGRLASDPEQYRLMVYCTSPIPGNHSIVDVAFPSQIEIKVNDDDVKANFRGLKGKAGSTKPADITKLVRPKAGYHNKLNICYALTQKRFVFVVYLVRYVPAAALVQKIRTNRVFPKARVLEEYARRNADPDIAATLSKMSLRDPVSTLRISVPVRSTFCSHNQCFDASFFMQLQEQAPTWQCPICSKTVSFESLSIDKYFEEILANTPQAIEQVTVEPTGEWHAVKDEEEDVKEEKKSRAAWDRDSDEDDEIIVLDDEPTNLKQDPVKKESPIKKEEVLSLPALASANINTPPTSTREPSIAQSLPHSATKRAAKVIDLTLSDDEDEPPRSAKRTRVDELPSRATSMLPTPLSLYPGRPQTHQPSGLPSFPMPYDMSVERANTMHTSPFSNTNGTSTIAFARSDELLARPSTHLGTSATNLLNQWNSFRSPPLPSPSLPAIMTDAQRRPSIPRLGEADGSIHASWPGGLGVMSTLPAPTAPPPQSVNTNETSNHTNLADGRFSAPSAHDAYRTHRLSAGLSGSPPSST